MVDISIIIPFRNQIDELERLVTSILNQNGEYAVEIIILDSSDSYEEERICNLSAKILYFKINPDDFNHGGTRNLGFSFSQGNIIVYTVQDAVPVDYNWLNNLVEPIKRYNLDAICGKQIPEPNLNTNPVDLHRPIDKPIIRLIEVSRTDIDNNYAVKNWEIVGWDNVNSAYKRDALMNVPFRQMFFGEDAQWAVDAVHNNLKIGFTCFAVVYHYHSFSSEFHLKRTLAEYYTRKVTIGSDPSKPQLRLRVVFSWILIISKTTTNPLRISYWLFHNLRIHKANIRAYLTWKNWGFDKIKIYLTENVPMYRNDNKYE